MYPIDYFLPVNDPHSVDWHSILPIYKLSPRWVEADGDTDMTRAISNRILRSVNHRSKNHSARDVELHFLRSKQYGGRREDIFQICVAFSVGRNIKAASEDPLAI